MDLKTILASKNQQQSGNKVASQLATELATSTSSSSSVFP